MNRYGVGQNREGESLLDVIQKGTGVNESQLQALDLLWVEQTVEGLHTASLSPMLCTDPVHPSPTCHPTVLQSEDPNHGDSVASRIIAGGSVSRERLCRGLTPACSTATSGRESKLVCFDRNDLARHQRLVSHWSSCTVPNLPNYDECRDGYGSSVFSIVVQRHRSDV